ETKVAENAVVLFDGAPVRYQEFHYFMLHKPAGYLTALSDGRDRTVAELMDRRFKDLSPVGRLDKDTEGLLLLTDDGALAHQLLSPKKEIPKTYYLRTETPISDTASDYLKEPVVYKEFPSRPADLKRLNEFEAEITVTEGKFHEVKRLMHAAGSDVAYLKRIAFGPLLLGDLPAGESRELSEEEIRALKEAVKTL
ncbi:MAG: rRNA pseudouridine synthase, partial [Lachnospiraceae bacterium]|nr:rRNA pseudouridine synthase [Lachnospiraceae bacterium]